MKKLLGFLMLSLAAFVSFAEDAYIESDGTQVILTDYYPTEKMRLVVDFAMVEETKELVIFGDKTSGSTGTTFQVWQNNAPNLEGNFISASNGDIWSGRLKTGIGTSRYTVKVDEVEGSFVLLNPDGSYADPDQKVKKPAGARRTGMSKHPLAFFANPPAFPDSAVKGAKMRLYGVSIYEDGGLVRQLVPCRKGDRVGLYDEKTTRFFGPFVGNPLASGGDIKTLEDDPYVEMDGTDYIQTDCVPGGGTRVEVDFALTDLKGQQFILDAGGKEDDPDYLLVRVYVNGSGATGGGFSWAFTDMGEKFHFADDDHQVKPMVLRRQQAILDGSANTAQFAVDGVLITERAITTAHTATCKFSDLRLFHNRHVNPQIYAKGRIYGLKISEDGELKRNYVAVRSGGRSFLRDTLSGEELFPSAQQPYVESAGNQYVTLDYKTSQKSVVVVDYSNLAADKDKRVFGTGVMQFWVNGTAGNQEFYSHSAWSGGFPGVPDQKRHRVVMDTPQSRIYYTDAIYWNKSVDMTTRTGYVETSKSSTDPMKLFNASTSPVVSDGASVRIYSAKVYEDGELIHLYQPYVKAGVVGFKDAKTGNFFPGLLKNGTTAVASTLTVGGAVACEGTEAYVECDQSQFILLDYIPKVTTKIELDYQLTKLRNDYYLLGCQKDPTWTFYVNGSYGYTFEAHSKWDGGRTTTHPDLMADMQRTTLTLDRPNGTAEIRRADITKSYALSAVASGDQTVKLGLFARQESAGTHYPNAGTASILGTVPMRVYSLRIWEAGDLKMELLPYKSGDVIGLKDRVSGKVYTSDIGKPFVLGGAGYKTASGAASTFVTALAVDASVAAGGTVTFGPVFAPGAIRYEWTRGGVPLAETGDTVTLEWERVKDDHTQVISVTPVYDVYGTEVKGEPSTATLTNAPRGMAVIIR